jgi:hypothetical protein
MPDLGTLGKWLIVAGLGLALIGGGLWLAGRAGLPLGRLPGDIRIERPGFSFYFPLASCLVVSLLLTALVNAVAWLLRR